MERSNEKLREEIRDLEKRISDAAGLSKEASDAQGGGEKPAAQDDGTSAALRVPAELIAGIGVGYFVGSSLDNLLETRPVFTMMCLLLGTAGAALNIYKALR